MQNQKEEKQLEVSLDALIQKVQDLKSSIAALIFKLENEYETLNWPSVLDNFALLSGKISSLHRLLKSDKVPDLRSRVFFPYVLSPDRDEELEKLTEGRVMAFNHEVVPGYLRTKPEPEVEEKVMQNQSKVGMSNADALQKQYNNMNKASVGILDMITAIREDWEAELNQRTTKTQMQSQADTNALLAAATFGKGLKSAHGPGPSGTTLPPVDQRGPQQGYVRTAYAYPGQQSKMQSSVRTNIKGASNVHPYNRP